MFNVQHALSVWATPLSETKGDQIRTGICYTKQSNVYKSVSPVLLCVLLKKMYNKKMEENMIKKYDNQLTYTTSTFIY